MSMTTLQQEQAADKPVKGKKIPPKYLARKNIVKRECPACHHKKMWTNIGGDYYECSKCRHRVKK